MGGAIVSLIPKVTPNGVRFVEFSDSTPEQVSAARAEKSLRDVQAQAVTDLQTLRLQTVDLLIQGQPVPVEVKDYHTALKEALAAEKGDVVTLPAKPVVVSDTVEVIKL